MKTVTVRLMATALLLLLSTATPRLSHAQAPLQPLSTDQQTLVTTALQTVVAVLQEVTFQPTDQSIGTRLRLLASQLTDATNTLQLTPPSALPIPLPEGAALASQAPPTATLSADDLAQLQQLLLTLRDQLAALAQELESNEVMTQELAPAQQGLDEALALVRTLRQETPAQSFYPRTAERTRNQDRDNEGDRAQNRDNEGDRDNDGWLRPGRYGDDPVVEDRRVDRRADRRANRRVMRDDDDEYDDHDAWEDDEDDDDEQWRRRHDDDWSTHSHAGAFIGDLTHRWPYRETGLYRTIPAVRYNRVEGLVLGIAETPLAWDSYSRAKLFGQVGYAFALDQWRYTIGAESRLGQRYGEDGLDLKIGGQYQRNTGTTDRWKANWAENSLASFFFEYDFFDYYDVEGWQVYTMARLSPYAQLSAGYQSEEYGSLTRNTGWSLFDGGTFRFNPAVDEGIIHAAVFALEGGRVTDLRRRPRGAAFRAGLESGEVFGGDFDFTRYEIDGRLYLPMGSNTLGLRGRLGGVTGDRVPFQKLFTVGGVGSVRAYPQNVFRGSHLLVANAEYSFSVFEIASDDLLFFALFDAAWVGNDGFDTFQTDDVLTAAGFGVGLDDRFFRLELAWPLQDDGGSRRPSLWLRLAPTF